MKAHHRKELFVLPFSEHGHLAFLDIEQSDPVSPGGCADLSLKRVGEYVLARCGEKKEALEELTQDPLYFPLEGPVDICVFGRGKRNQGAPLATFSEVEILAPDR